jgi:FtsX-like permease family
MGLARGSLTLPRMNAHRLVIVAAALTTVVAAALGAALATFSGQALPRAIRHDLGAAAGTPLVINGAVNPGQAAQYDSILPTRISSALRGTPFAFYQAAWSDPFGFVAGSPPSLGAQPAGAGQTQIVEAAALGDIAAHVVLVSGTWPGPRLGGPIPAALPATAAALLHVTDGDVLRLMDRLSGRNVSFVITGLYRPRQASSEYWSLDEIALTGSSTVGGFTTYGPLTVRASAFGGPLAVSGGSWLAVPETADIPAGQLTTVAANVAALQQALGQAQVLPGLTLTTSLPSVLYGTASNLDVARSLLAICAVLLFLLAAAALVTVARLLADQREGESAMLTARGATRWQVLRLAAAEAVPLCALSSVAGGVTGVLLARLFTGTGPEHAGPVGPIDSGAWLAAAAVAVGALVIMLAPTLSQPTPGRARARRGRQSAVPAVTRAGADLAVALLAVLAGWQLRHYSAVSAGANGSYGVDPVVAAAPALALAGGTVLALRLLPVIGRACDRLAARGRQLTAALASWQISRQPIRQGGTALLIVLAVATGTLALSQHQSWTRSDHDQAAFSTGADVRVDTGAPLSAAQAGALVRTPGVRHAMPVAAFPGDTPNSETLAVDAGQAADTALLRTDQSPLPEARLFGEIRPPRVAAAVMLPGRPLRLRLAMRLGPASLGLAPATVTVSVADADSNVYQLNAGVLAADGGVHALTVTVSGGPAIYPLRLAGISMDYVLPATRPRAAAALTVDNVSVDRGTALLPGAALRGSYSAASSPDLENALQTAGTAGPSGPPSVSSAATGRGTLTVSFNPGYGQAASDFGLPPSPLRGRLALTAAPPATVIPGLATQRFLAVSNASVGSTVQTHVNGAAVSVDIVAAVSTFPTVSAAGGALVVDLGALQGILAGSSAGPAQATQWWLATSGLSGSPGQMPPRLTAVLPPGTAVTSADGVASRLLGDPLSTVPQQGLLAVALAAAVLAIAGFCVGIAAGLRQRRAENALLAALGVTPRAAAGQLCLEKLMLSLPSALAGLVLGVVLARLLVPAITLTSAATTPVPPVLVQFGWSQTLPLALAIAVLPVLAAALTVARRPDAAADLRTAEAT